MDSLATSASQGWTVTEIERQIPPIAHSAMYNWHKYWARKTWNVVGAFVEAYCPPGGVVLDPFAGSGVLGIEAVRRGRRAILADLTPIMEEVVWATLVDVSPDTITAAFERIKAAVGDEVQSLYRTSCPTCGTEQPSWANVWEDGHLIALRYVCQNQKCAERHEKGALVTTDDLAVFAAAKAKHYNRQRTHRALGLAPPRAEPRDTLSVGPRGVRRWDLLGGLIHEYHGAAA